MGRNGAPTACGHFQRGTRAAWRRWAMRRTLLRPIWGSGAQAIEDAWVLAESLAHNSEPEQAFAAYQRVRQAKATMIVNRSWQMGKLAHLKNPLGRMLRNSLMRGVPPSVGQKQFDALSAYIKSSKTLSTAPPATTGGGG